MTPPGLVALAVRRRWAEAIFSSLVIAAVLLVNLSYPEWTGGWSTGPRLLVPMLPFAMLPVAGLLALGGRWAGISAVVLTLVGSIAILGCVAVGGRIADTVDRPLVDGVWPLIRGDRPLPWWVYGQRYARNLASLSLPEAVKRLPVWAGWATLAPLVLFQVAMIGGMLRLVRDEVESGKAETQAGTALVPDPS